MTVYADHEDHDIHDLVLEIHPSRPDLTVDEDCDCPPGCEQCEDEGVMRPVREDQP